MKSQAQVILLNGKIEQIEEREVNAKKGMLEFVVGEI